jgi:hypothetical protein
MNFRTVLQVMSFLATSMVPTSLMAQAPASGDGNWPKEIVTDQIHLLLYQPQADTWTDNRIEARSAVMLTQLGDPKQMFGMIVMNARTEIDRETRTVSLEDINIKEVNLPSAGSLQPVLLKAVRDSVPDWPKTVSLDRLLADLSITQAQTQAESIRLKNDPPRIVFSTTPAVLIIIDGEPIYKPVEGTRYTRVMNTLALLLFDSSGGTFYLDGGRWWMTAPSLNGPWSAVADPPQEIAGIKDQLKKEEDQEEQSAPANPNEVPPAVYVSTVPAELVVTNGNPQYAPIAKTNLLYVTNTESDIFMDSKSQQYYALLAGRWFTARSTNGPWGWVPGDRMPRDFSRIPPESPQGHVLASIPGTEQAKEAVIANQIPQTATVRRSEAKLDVRYDGPPRFMPIQGTSMEYAVNTITEVIHAEGRYYAIQHGVWFVADSPLGPWVVADMIPAVIYTIPPNSPLYHARYAYVYGATPEYVYVGYTPGYLGAYAYDGVVVFGTGWGYPGLLCGDYWCGGPWTWGFGFQFSYWGGGWFFRPAGHYWWYHNPPFAHRIYSEHWNPQWRGSNPTWIRNNVNVYKHWQGNALAARTLPGLQRGAVAPLSRGASRPDMYAGRDGQVYQHNQRGWSAPNNSGQWQRVPSNPGLEQQRQSRSLGQSRQDEFQRRGQTPGIPRTASPRGRTSAPPRSAAPPRGGGHR